MNKSDQLDAAILQSKIEAIYSYLQRTKRLNEVLDYFWDFVPLGQYTQLEQLSFIVTGYIYIYNYTFVDYERNDVTQIAQFLIACAKDCRRPNKDYILAPPNVAKYFVMEEKYNTTEFGAVVDKYKNKITGPEQLTNNKEFICILMIKELSTKRLNITLLGIYNALLEL